MQRFVNNPDYIVDDMINGISKAHDYIVKSNNNDHVVKYAKTPIQGKVGVVSGGGSGHEPAFLGYVGKNMLDAVAIGEVFSSPPATAFYDAFMEADSGSGVACLFGNYAGDNMNVKMAIQMAEEDGVSVKYVVANDDVASSPKESRDKRHGIAGGVFMWKIGCAKAAEGAVLDEVIRVAEKTVKNTRSICVGLSSCTIPAVGKPNFIINEGSMEIGIGHHGEPGTSIEDVETADKIAIKMCEALFDDIDINEQDEIAMIVSGMGSTPIMELYVLYDEMEKFVSSKNVTIYKPLVGNYVTSLDMNGVALTILKLDDELKKLLDVSCHCPALIIE